MPESNIQKPSKAISWSDKDSFSRVRRVIAGDLDESQLKPRDRQCYDRWNLMYSLSVKYGQNRTMIVEAYKRLKAAEHDPAIHYGLGYLVKQVKQAIDLFGDFHEINRKVTRGYIVDQACMDVENINTMIQQALRDEQDGVFPRGHYAKMYERLLPLKTRSLNAITKAAGLNNYDPDSPQAEDIQKHEYTIQLDPVSAKLLEKMSSSQSGSYVDGRELFQNLEAEELEIDNDDDTYARP